MFDVTRSTSLLPSEAEHCPAAGQNIVPVQTALGWGVEKYGSREIRRAGNKVAYLEAQTQMGNHPEIQAASVLQGTLVGGRSVS